MVNHFGDRLVEQIRKFKSFLCLGVDPHLDLIPEIFNENETINNIKIVETFCFSLLEAVIGKVPAIKPQIALFEQLGPEGMVLLSSLCKYAHSKGFLVIMDAKRGDIGSTSKAYANAYLGKNAPFPSDALTVNPWLGLDSLEPFFSKAQDTGSGLFILIHTSNKGSQDIQEILTNRDLKCYEHLANILKPIIEKNNGQSLRFRGGGGMWKKDGEGTILIGIYCGISGPNNWVHIGCTPCVYIPSSNPQLRSIKTKWNSSVKDKFYNSDMRSYRHFIKSRGYPKQNKMKKRIIKKPPISIRRLYIQKKKKSML